MGCSPSKGKLFSKPEALGLQGAPPAEPPQAGVDHRPEDEEDTRLNLKPDEEEEPVQLADEAGSEETASDTTARSIEDIHEAAKPPLQVINNDVMQTDEIKKTEKQKKNRSKKRSIEKQKKCSLVKAKVDFPLHMVRAHQAAYAFLNPNISRLESLLVLLDDAAQTHTSLQPMMSTLVLRFEEVNQALEEMAEEGELVLKEHGDYMASGTMPRPVRSKPSFDSAHAADPPPDLLQQLLQHSAEKMKLVGGSVQAVGDKTLQEAVEYFSSLSYTLSEKLRAKQKAELRLTQVLARVEGAAVRKSFPEDTALHSEDSGIGGENESLTGSERHRRHRGSAGSSSLGSGGNIRGGLDSFSTTLTNKFLMAGHNEDDEEDEDEEDDEDDEEDEDEENDRPERKRASSFPADANQANYPQVSWPPRPPTTAKPSQRQPIRSSESPRHNLCRAGLRRHSLNGSGGPYKSPFRRNKPPGGSMPPLQRHSVRRLINTFSHGVDGRPGQSLANIPPHIRRPNKSRILLLSDAAHHDVVNDNNNNNSWQDGRDDLDVDNLPPPPPEVLMDDSFQSSEDPPENEDDSSTKLPVIHQRGGVSQKLKLSMQNVEVLPNRATVRARPAAILPGGGGQEAVSGAQHEKHLETDPEGLDQQARKEPPPARMPPRCEHLYDSETPPCSLPVIAPPVSRVRLPPSCPSVRHRFPSPPTFIPQSTSRPSSRPNSPRTIPRPTNNPDDVVPSFRDARSFFLRNELQTSETCPPPGAPLPPRGRLGMRKMDGSTRRTQSEQRPYGTSHSDCSTSASGCNPPSTE